MLDQADMPTSDADTSAATTAAAAPPSGDDAGWEYAIVEIYGHRNHVGRCMEVEKFGGKMLRIDSPIFTAREEGNSWPRKIVDLKLDHWETHLYGGNAIFSFTPSDRDSIMKLAERKARIEPPATYQIAAQEDAEIDHSQDELEF